MREAGMRVLARRDAVTLVEELTPHHLLVLDGAGEDVASLVHPFDRIHVMRTLPETALAALPGRPLSDCIDLTGLVARSDAIIVSACLIRAGRPTGSISFGVPVTELVLDAPLEPLNARHPRD